MRALHAFLALFFSLRIGYITQVRIQDPSNLSFYLQLKTYVRTQIIHLENDQLQLQNFRDPGEKEKDKKTWASSRKSGGKAPVGAEAPARPCRAPRSGSRPCPPGASPPGSTGWCSGPRKNMVEKNSPLYEGQHLLVLGNESTEVLGLGNESRKGTCWVIGHRGGSLNSC